MKSFFTLTNVKAFVISDLEFDELPHTRSNHKRQKVIKEFYFEKERKDIKDSHEYFIENLQIEDGKASRDEQAGM